VYGPFAPNLTSIAAQLRANYGIFPREMCDQDVCIKFARRMHDSCLNENDIVMLARMSEDWVDFRGQLESWSAPVRT
jgi:hypothetical protein